MRAGGENTMSEGFRGWLDEEGKSRTTTRQYVRSISRAQRWLRGNGHPLLRQADWQAIRDYAQTLPLSHASRSSARNAINAYMTYCGRPALPRGAVRVPRRPRMRHRAIPRADFERVLTAARAMGPVQTAAACLAYYTALRRFEIAQVRWEDIRGDLLWVVGKGYKEDWLPIHPNLERALRDVQRTGTGRYVFESTMRPGTHVADGTLNVWFTALRLASGVDVTPHVLRHTSITVGTQKTKDLRSAQRFARHEDPRTTSLYAAPSEQGLRDFVAAL